MAKLGKGYGVGYTKTIKVDPFANPQLALQVIAEICSTRPVGNAYVVIQTVMNEILKGDTPEDNLKAFFLEKRLQGDVANFDFWSELKEKLEAIRVELEANEKTVYAQIVVAGGFNSGKSTFLNSMMGRVDLLPTDIKACSVIPTYIYSSKGIENVLVRGLNQRNAIVPLSLDVLQCIRHESVTQVYFSSVLEKLFVEVPENDNVKGLAFIDTPGYDKAEAEKNPQVKTDEETAINSLKEGNVLFWVMDAQVGAITTEDKKMIDRFTGKRIVIVLNKADLKTPSELEAIRDGIKAMFQNEYDNEKLLDIITYSSVAPDEAYSSLRGYSLGDLFNKVRVAGDKYDRVKELIDEIGFLFDLEIGACLKSIARSKELFEQDNQTKTDLFQFCHNDGEANKQFIETLTHAIVESYTDLDKRSDKIAEIAGRIYSDFIDYYNAIVDKLKSAWFPSTDLINLSNSAFTKIENVRKQIDEVHQLRYYYDEESRQTLVDTVRQELDKLNKLYSDNYEQIKGRCQSYLDNKECQKKMIEDLEGWKKKLVSTLKQAVNDYIEHKAPHPVHDATVVEVQQPVDVFSAMQSGDMKAFLSCFKDGLNVETTFSDEGYTPVTYAVKLGANDIVQFFIDHNVDLGFVDRRGYNAYLTAVENNYKDLCLLLASVRPDLKNSKSRDGKTAQEIAENNTFVNWLKNN